MTLSLLLAACGQSTHSELKIETPSNVTQLEGDLPSRGRSLFDAITISQNPAGFYEQVIPYPFSKLRAQIEAQTLTPALVTLIPKGRSLQRNATDKPFLFPRVILTATGEARQSAGSLGILLKDRLYLGYVEESKQLEIISFNPEAGRFEFQLIENYGEGQIATIKYANRSFCLSCHQNASPIFSEAPWDETVANTQISDRVLAEHRSAEYLGVPIRQFRNVPNEIDNATDRSNLLTPYQTLWAKGCTQSDPLETARCRRQTLELALQYLVGGDYDTDLYETVRASYSKAWASQLPNGLDIFSPNIPNFNPLLKPTGAKDPIFLEDLGLEVNHQLEVLAQDADIPANVDPLKDRTKPAWQEWRLAKSDAARLIFAIVENVTSADIAVLQKEFKDPNRITEVLDLFEVQSMSMLKNDSFDRCEWIPDLLELAGASTLARCLPNSNANWPAAQATGVHAVITSTDLKLFFTYCGACHQSGPRNFLAGATEEAVKLGLSKNAAEHIQRLNWEAPIAGRSSMPPNNTAQHVLLLQAPADRAKMIQYLEDLR